ncbi:putative NADH-flavin reductase [Arthrobacter sp. UYP6]|uniref:NAD(P)-dependent oxidoreductase n=1 Tax=Arthrobacter sp. UYP6 TaxID=1756378 RepID=UPI003392F224
MRITVFGGTGYAGSNIVAEAVARGHAVTSISRNAPEHPLEGVSYVAADVRIPADRQSVLSGADVVVIALSPVGDMAETMEDAVLSFAREAGTAGVRVGVIGGAGSLMDSPGGMRLDESEAMPELFKSYSVILTGVLDGLRRTTEDVDWFYISPAENFGAYNPGRRHGSYRIGGDVLVKDEHGISDISGADFGAAVIDEVENNVHRRQRFTVAY